MTAKDVYSLPWTHKMLECLCGAVWFTFLDVKLREECKAYTAFTMDLLGFYECECMTFGLTNTPAIFQHLMETCLGDLQLN